MSAQQHTTPDVQSNGAMEELTPETARRLLDDMSQFLFDISGEEFLHNWNAGKYADRMDEPRMESMSIFMRLIRDEL